MEDFNLREYTGTTSEAGSILCVIVEWVGALPAPIYLGDIGSNHWFPLCLMIKDKDEQSLARTSGFLHFVGGFTFWIPDSSIDIRSKREKW
jgi:hypothetical protein